MADRDELYEVIADHSTGGSHEVEAIVDALISAGMVRGHEPTVTARQFDAAANFLAYSLHGLDMASCEDRERLRALLGVLGLTVVDGDVRA